MKADMGFVRGEWGFMPNWVKPVIDPFPTWVDQYDLPDNHPVVIHSDGSVNDWESGDELAPAIDPHPSEMWWSVTKDTLDRYLRWKNIPQGNYPA